MIDLNFKTFGEGFPLVILHGLFGTLDNWQTQAKAFADHYSVYILDQRNHGRSPHLPAFDYPTMAEDLHQFLDQHWIYETFLMGHSMGGKTAMEYALRYPDHVQKLIIVDIAPKEYAPGHEAIFAGLNAFDPATITSRQEAEDYLAPKVPDPGVRQFLLKNLSRNKTGGYEWKMNLPVIQEKYADILQPPQAEGPYNGPTLFIRGERSSYVLDEDLPRIHRYFPRAQLLTIPGAGHWVHAEAPEALLDAVLQFLREPA